MSPEIERCPICGGLPTISNIPQIKYFGWSHDDCLLHGGRTFKKNLRNEKEIIDHWNKRCEKIKNGTNIKGFLVCPTCGKRPHIRTHGQVTQLIHRCKDEKIIRDVDSLHNIKKRWNDSVSKMEEK